MEMDLDLEEIILYLNATEPTGKFCKNIENLQNKLSKAQEQEKENKKMKNILLELADIDPDNIDCINQCKSIINKILKANISDDINNKCKENLIFLNLR